MRQIREQNLTMKSSLTKQSRRIYDYLKERAGEEVSAVKLHRIGSGKENGFCGSFSKRIWEAREEAHAQGGAIVLTKDEFVNTVDDYQRQTGYTYFKDPVAPVVKTEFGTVEVLNANLNYDHLKQKEIA